MPVEFATAVYQARPGTLSTLEALADKELIIVGGPGESIMLFSPDTLDVYAPTRFRLTTPEGLVLVLGQDRGVEHLTDPNGHTLTFGPDGLRHSAGTSVRFTRDGQGRITRLTDPLGHTLQYTYDAAGDLVAVTDQEGQTTRYTYDTAHRLLAITDPRGMTVAQSRYDAAGRMAAQIDAAGHRTHDTHDATAHIHRVLDAKPVLSVLNKTEKTEGARDWYNDKPNAIRTQKRISEASAPVMNILFSRPPREDRSSTSKVLRWNWFRSRKLIVREKVSTSFIGSAR